MQNAFPDGPKYTWEQQAQQITDGKVQIGDCDIPMLLEWLRDYNWPGASQIGDYLVEYGDAVIEPIRRALLSDDILWIYWLLVKVVSRWPLSRQRKLESELWLIASRLDEEGAHLAALELCVDGRLRTAAELGTLIEERQASDSVNAAEYAVLMRKLEQD